MKKSIFISILLHLAGAYFSTGFFHYDEQFQILEFASYKKGQVSAEQLPWEFRSKARPALQPFIAYAASSLTSSPFAAAFLLRGISVLLSVSICWILYLTFKDELLYSKSKKWLLMLFLFFWIPFFLSLRFSSENWSALFLSAGAGTCLLAMKSKQPSKILFVVSGFSAGLSFYFRFSTGIIIFFFITWWLLFRKESIRYLWTFLGGIVLSIFLGIITDRWFYGVWTFTPWNYYNSNFILGQMEYYGILPWWYYLRWITIYAIPPFSILLMISVLVFWVKFSRHSLTWLTAPFFIFLLFTGHKELRFLFPLIYFLPPVLTLIWDHYIPILKTRINEQIFYLLLRTSVFLFIPLNSILLIAVMIIPQKGDVQLYSFISKHYPADKKVNLIIAEKINFRSVDLLLSFYRPENLNTIFVKDPGEIQKNSIPSLFCSRDSNLVHECLSPQYRFTKLTDTNQWFYWISSFGRPVYYLYRIDFVNTRTYLKNILPRRH